MSQAYIDLLLERQELIDRHRHELREFDQRIVAFRDSCPHAHTRYHADPCGGFNGFYACDDCERDLGKKWPVES